MSSNVTGIEADCYARLRVQIILALIFIISFSHFHGGIDNWNSISRLALTANFVQHGRLDIGGYEKKTGDKARFGGAYYSDKAPGMSFLAFPVAALYMAAIPVTSDGDLKKLPLHGAAALRYAVFAYLCTMSTSALLTALAAVLLFGYVCELTGSFEAGLVASVTYGLGTPTWIWATAFFGHAAAGALLMAGFILTDRIASAKAGRTERVSRIVLAGMALGASVSVEFTAAVPVAIILGYSALRRLLTRGYSLRSLLAPAATGAVAIAMQIPLLAYNYEIFGTPFHLAYANVVGQMGDGMRTGFFGIFVPNLKVAAEILFGRYRGVLWLSPILIPAGIGLIWWLIVPGSRLRAAAIFLIVLFYILLNAGYLYWHGGWSTGPRHITPSYPFLALALGVWFAQVRPALRCAVTGLLWLSVFITLACVSVDCCSSERIRSPLFKSILPSFYEGELDQSVLYLLFGTRGHAQLIPLLSAWALLGFLLLREMRKKAILNSAAASLATGLTDPI
jgi:hypothetical protein